MRLYNTREGFSEADGKLPSPSCSLKTMDSSKNVTRPDQIRGSKERLLFVDELGCSHRNTIT
jgi:hypothetical protein